jgi:hypothetical protein
MRPAPATDEADEDQRRRHAWPTAANPLTRLAPHVEQADQLGPRNIAPADIRKWSFQASGGSTLSPRIPFLASHMTL